MYRNISAITRVTLNLCRREITTLSVIQKAAEELPKKNYTKFLDPQKIVNYMSNYAKATSLCKGLLNIGIHPETNILMWTESTHECLTMFWACAMMGLHLITIDPKITEDIHIKQIMEQSKAKILLFSPDSATISRVSLLSRLIPELKQTQDLMFCKPLNHIDFSLQYVVAAGSSVVQGISVMSLANLFAEFSIKDYLTYIMPQITDDHKLLSGYKLSKNGDMVHDKGYTQSQCVDIARGYIDTLNFNTDDSMTHGIPLCSPEGLIASLVPTFVNATMVIPSRFNHANFFISGSDSQQCRYFIMDRQMHTELSTDSSTEMIKNTLFLKDNFKPENILVI